MRSPTDSLLMFVYRVWTVFRGRPELSRPLHHIHTIQLEIAASFYTSTRKLNRQRDTNILFIGRINGRANKAKQIATPNEIESNVNWLWLDKWRRMTVIYLGNEKRAKRGFAMKWPHKLAIVLWFNIVCDLH